MFQFEANEAVIVEQKKALETALTTNPKTAAVLRKIIRKYILEARADVAKNIRFKHGDPRGTAQAVRTSVYRKVFGGNINIFNSRRAHGSSGYEPPRKGTTGRGGNRHPRSARTAQIMNYAPLDRGFILRWLNEGAKDRHVNFKHDPRRKETRWNTHPNTGNRGSITERNFFRSLGDRALGQMRDTISTVIEEEMHKLIAS